MRARIEAARRWSEHDAAIFGEGPSDAFFKDAKSRPAPPIAPKLPGKTLLEFFEDFAKAKASILESTTIEDSRKTVVRFSESIGHAREVDGISREDARTWRNHLSSWPQYADQVRDFEGLDFDAVLVANKAVGREPISSRTANKYIADMSGFFTWLQREEIVTKNIFESLTFDRPKDEQTTFPLSTRQIDVLLQSPLFTTCRNGTTIPHISSAGDTSVRDWRYWILLVALLSGARQGEISRLELQDVQREDGIDFIHITNQGEGEGKSVKASYSKRRVPIHSRLVDLGFMDFIDAARRSSRIMIFPGVKRDSRGYFSQVSKFYQRYFDAIEMRKMEPVSTNFHSLRHSFIDELRVNYPQDDEFKALLGHSGKNVTSGYGVREAQGLKSRQQMVESVVYAGVNFDALMAASEGN